jgi:putative ABC transport system ATP-binding protein
VTGDSSSQIAGPPGGAASPDDAIVRLDGVCKIYDLGLVKVEALRAVDILIRPGEYLSIMGPSGSGKSTLLNLLGCLDRPSAGRYFIDGTDVSHLDDDELSEIRNRKLGFVFQSYNLLPQLTVLENIEVPLFYQGMPEKDSRVKATELASRMGLDDRLEHRPMELSGGQQQRVAIARALANDPVMILADEPTGNLDTNTGDDVLELMDELHSEGKTLVVVTHDSSVAQRSRRIIRMRDGRVESDEAVKPAGVS